MKKTIQHTTLKLRLVAIICIFFFSSLSSVFADEDLTIEASLRDFIIQNPQEEIIVVVSLQTNNEGMLDEIREKTRNIRDAIEQLSDDVKTRYQLMERELGYYENEKVILKLLAENDPDFMQRLADLNKKYALDETSMQKISKHVELLNNERAKIILEILHSRYTPIQDEFTAELHTIPSAQVVYQNLLTNTVTVQLKASDVNQISLLPNVYTIIHSVEEDTQELAQSIPTIGANTWHSNGFTGADSVPLFINSDGINVNHPNLVHITFLSACFFTGCNPINAGSGHDTAVTGVIGSDDFQNKGVAYGINMLYNAQTNSFATAQQAVAWSITNFTQQVQADMVTMSKTWGGVAPPFCGDSTEEKYVDEIVDLFDVNWIKSAGNNGASGVTLPAGAYNILAVGASDDKGNILRSDDTIWSGSSLGPVGICNSAETRIKPDITAPGVLIKTPTGLDSMSSWTGTSFAAPHVTGSIVLIDQKTSKLLSSEEIRALLLNSAEDRLQSTGASGNDGPDNTWGYGYLDMNKAYFDIGGVENGNLGSGDTVYYKFTFVNPNDTATLVWNRHIVGNTGFTNNLDLYLYDEATNTLIDSSEYVGRNIEHVIADGSYASTVVKVKLTTQVIGSSEDFGIAVDGAINDTNLPTLSVIMNTSQNVFCGSNKNLTVSVKNNGPIAAHNVNVNINLPSGVTLVTGANPQNLGTIIVGETKTASWIISQTNPTALSINAVVESNSYGEQLVTGVSIKSSCSMLVTPNTITNAAVAKVCKRVSNVTNTTC